MQDVQEPVITFTVSYVVERLEKKIDEGFADLNRTVSRKADASEMDALARKVDSHTLDLEKIKADMQASRDARGWRTEWRRWITTTVLSAALVAVTIYTLLHGGG